MVLKNCDLCRYEIKNTKDANGLPEIFEETVKAIAMVPFINEDVDEDLIGTRPIKAMVLKYWMKIIHGRFVLVLFNLGRKSCFHRKQDEYRFNGYKYRRQNSLNNEEEKFN